MKTGCVRRLVLAAGLFAVLGACANMGMGSSVKLGGPLSGAQEVPPVATNGTGRVDATFDKSTRKLTYTVVHSGLSAAPTAGHFHGPAAMGQNAGVVVPFPNATSPIRGEATLTEAQAADLLAGRWYANIHTASHPAGEIRGQVMPQ
jgi:hypothetical protein